MPYKKTQIWGQILSADNSLITESARRIPMYYRNSLGVPTAVVLGANDMVEIESVQMLGTGAGLVEMYDGSDVTVGAGEAFWAHRAATAGGGSLAGATLIPSHFCAPGTYPKQVILTGSAGWDVSFKGWLWEYFA